MVAFLNEPELFFCAQLNGFKYFYALSQFSISHLFEHIICSIWLIDRTLLGATTPGQSGLESNGNEGVFCIPQISKAEASSSDGLMLYLGHSWEESLTPLQRCSRCIL